MIFKELVLQNFGPYRGRQIIDLSPETGEGHRPIVLFGGLNGGGKTTLMDALRLALYGYRAQCSTRGNLSYKDFLMQSLNRHAQEKERACVELSFQLTLGGSPTELRVRRVWDQQLKGGREMLFVLRGSGEEAVPDMDLTNTWDERIEEILPLGISNLFLFDGEQIKELAEQEVPTPSVVDAIRSLLGLELATRLSNDLEVLIARKVREVAGKRELQDLDDIETRLTSKEKELRAAKQILASLQNDLDVAREEERLAYETYISEGANISADSSQLSDKIKLLEAEAEEQRQHLRELAAGCLPLMLIEDLLGQTLAQAKQEQHMKQVQASWEILRERDQRLLRHIGGLSSSPEMIHQVKSFLEQENQELLDEVQGEKVWLGVDGEITEQLSKMLGYQLPLQVKLAKEAMAKLESLLEEIESSEKYRAAAAPKEQYEQLAENLKQRRVALSRIELDYEKEKLKCDQLKQSVDQIKKELVRYSHEKIKHKSKEQMIASAAKAQETLVEFSQTLTLRKLNQLESLVMECFLYLLHKPDLIQRVAIDVNTFGLSLYDSMGREVPKRRLSAGEKQLLAVSLLWGLARASGRNLPIAIDTPLSRLDSSHRANLVERYFPAAGQQVILLSTDTEITQVELERLRQDQAIGKEYRLMYDPVTSQTVVQDGYFW